MEIVVGALTVVVGLLTVLVVGMLRSMAEIRDAEGAGKIGKIPLQPAAVANWPEASIPSASAEGTVTSISGQTPTGRALAIAMAPRETDTLLAFLGSGCDACGVFWKAFREHAPGTNRRYAITIVTRDSAEEQLAMILDLAPLEGSGIMTVMSSATWNLFDVPLKPYFILVSGAHGLVIGQGAASSWAQVSSLVADAYLEGDLSGDSSTGAGIPSWQSERVDDVLRRAGISPDDPSMYSPE
jgi:hypothetical protein